MKPLPEKRERFGNWLRRQLEERVWSQQDLANRLVTTQPRVNKWVQGKEFPNPYNRKRICEAFGVTIEELNNILRQGETQNQEAKEDASVVEIPHDHISGYENSNLSCNSEDSTLPMQEQESSTLNRGHENTYIVSSKTTPVPFTLNTLNNNPYDQFNPYQVTPPSRRMWSRIIISWIVVAAVILGVVVGIFVLASQSCREAFSGEFHGKLDSRWNWVNPRGNATYSITTNGPLILSTPPHSDLYPKINFNAPRLLQSINGDFTIDTLIKFSPNTHFQSAGILLWQDQATFLRIERGFDGKSSGVLFQKFEHGGTLNNVGRLEHHLTTAGSVELRVQRKGDHFAASWREPGQIWQFEGETDLHSESLFESLKVGLDLIADYNAPQTTASYDYFKVSCS